MSILLSLGVGWLIPPLDRGVTMRALQTPILWPIHWISTLVCFIFSEGRIQEGQLEGGISSYFAMGVGWPITPFAFS